MDSLIHRALLLLMLKSNRKTNNNLWILKVQIKLKLNIDCIYVLHNPMSHPNLCNHLLPLWDFLSQTA